ncbi:MAG: acetylxylan esterase [bacterium]|nr:acetylxylan esterase [bacterium]
MRKALFLALFAIAAILNISAQESIGTFQVRVSLDRPDWKYELGQPAKFSIATTLNNSQAAGLPVKYSCGPEQQPAVIEKTVTSTDQPIVVETPGMKDPGFYRCIATVEKEGRTYRGLATAGYRPDQIKPVVTEPADFDKFWNEGKAALAKIPLDAKMELLPSLSTSKVDVYHVSFQNVGMGISRVSRIYGILCVPKDVSKKYPAVLRVPGAGVRNYTGQVALAETGLITLEIGIHGIPVNLPLELYDQLRVGALNRYMLYNLNDRDEYYYRRVFLGTVRSNDFLASLPQYDGKNLGVIGGSQGGILSIATAALDPRVKALVASYPAMSDMAGYTANRAGGWPHMFRDVKNRTKENLETASYYDTVNFSRRLKVPGIYSWGFNDETCPPTSMYASYNVITAPKTLLLGLEMGHANSVEQNDRLNTWIEKFLKEGKAQ